MSVEQGDSAAQCNRGILNLKGECDPAGLIEARRLLGIMNLKGECDPTGLVEGDTIDFVSLTDENRCLVSGDGEAPLLSLGQDLLRMLLMLDGIGRYEVGNIRLCCKALLEVVGLRHDEQVGVLLAFDGAAVFRQTSNSKFIDLRPLAAERILACAFRDSELASLKLPASVTHIGNRAFLLSELTSLDLPALVTHIGDYAFFNSKLTSLEGSASVIYIGNRAFFSSRFTSHDLTSSVTQIGDIAFGKSRLTSLDIPASVTHIGDFACLGSMTFAERTLPTYHVTMLDSLVERGMSFGRNPKLNSFLCPIVQTMGRTQIPFSNSRQRTTRIKIRQKFPSATRGSLPRSAVVLIFHAESAAIAERVLSHYLRR